MNIRSSICTVVLALCVSTSYGDAVFSDSIFPPNYQPAKPLPNDTLVVTNDLAFPVSVTVELYTRVNGTVRTYSPTVLTSHSKVPIRFGKAPANKFYAVSIVFDRGGVRDECIIPIIFDEGSGAFSFQRTHKQVGSDAMIDGFLKSLNLMRPLPTSS